MSSRTLAKEWLRSNDPKFHADDGTVKKRIVRYRGLPFPEPKDELENAANQEFIAATPFRNRGTTGYSTKHPAHSRSAMWLMKMKDFDKEQCLILPNALPGSPASVRYNCKEMAASRAMCIIVHGLPENPKHQAIHSCGNGHLSCVNPKHIRWGTNADNQRDRQIHAKAYSTAERITVAEADGKN